MANIRKLLKRKREGLFQLIPWVKQLKENRRRRIIRLARLEARGRIKTFGRLKGLSIGDRKKIVTQIIHFESKLSLNRAIVQEAKRFMMLPIAVSLMTVCLSIPQGLNSWFGMGFEWWVIALISFGSFILMGLLVGIAFLPSMIAPFQARGTSLLLMFWGIFSLVSYAYIFYQFFWDKLKPTDVSWHWLLISSALVSAVVYILGAYISIPIISVFTNLMLSRRRKKFPVALFVHNLIEALYSVETCKQTWTELETKRIIMRKIEEAARVVGERIAPELPTFDIETDATIRRRLDAIAAAIRAKKYWVCTPKDDTRERLVETLSKSVINAALGNWDYLETGEKSKLATRESKARVRVFLVGVIVASVPFLVYQAAILTNFLPEGALANYLQVGVVIWAILSLLYAIDTRFGEKVETLKSLASMLPGIPGKKNG